MKNFLLDGYLPAIDIHTHYNSGSPFDSTTHALYQCTPSFLREEYESANIALGCFSSFASVCSTEPVYEENVTTAALAAEHPWFYYWAVIYPHDSRTYEQAHNMLADEKCIGIKIHPSYHQYTLADYGDAIFSFAAERNATVLMHPAEFDRIPSFADAYRDCRIIVAHLGSLEHVDCIRRAAYGNVYTDTSGSASLSNNVLEYAVSQIGAERILFGTDTYSAGSQRGRIEFARITAEKKKDILYRNALRMFPKLRGTYPPLA